MKEKINQKGFIQIPLLIAIIIATISVASAGTGAVLYSQGKLAPLVANISEIFKETEEESTIAELEPEITPELKQFPTSTKEESIEEKAEIEEKVTVDYEQVINQLQQEMAILKEQQQNKTQNDTQWLQQQIDNLQQQLQQEKEQLKQIEQQETKSTPQEPSKLDINQLSSQVAQVECSGGLGSGFLISSDGVIVTNHHVVKEPMYEQKGKLYRRAIAGEWVPGCIISFTDNPDIVPNVFYWATIPGSFDDSEKDLAILYIQAIVKNVVTNDLRFLDDSERNFSFFTKCSKNDFEIGDEIIALGYPGVGGDTITITEGILSGSLGIYYKISAKLNPGNSGGPVILNSNENRGCYIGVVTWANIGGIESQPYAVKAEYVPF